MARKPLRSQLNQIRAWVRQGRTDAWIAHQLDVSASELREFRRRHELTADDDDSADLDLRDEIEAEIEAEMEAEADEPDDEEEDERDEDRDEDEGGERRRRRRRRGGRGRGRRSGTTVQGTFDHGERDGFGLWLDPAVQDDQTYQEHWAGHRRIEVTIDSDRIVIRRAED